ncbi:PREDICTED: uncharacterized protein LOC104723989 isoform X3 [Camelina sativa]|uniref:Uncharacterized protein LOC104723989 isoform X3 n=1 Tax=Camelina sativa TaxID=90675 RepID=A0ABM1QMB3_CAMSA|nr:PREDICTED: uncharacterized protein LOC104723989 isoform X3 [Camelina sativa]
MPPTYKIVCDCSLVKCSQGRIIRPTRHFPRPYSALTRVSDREPAVVPIREPIMTLNLKIPTPKDLHIPAPILAKIVSYVAQDGAKALKNWLLAGREGRVVVHSLETLSKRQLHW